MPLTTTATREQITQFLDSYNIGDDPVGQFPALALPRNAFQVAARKVRWPPSGFLGVAHCDSRFDRGDPDALAAAGAVARFPPMRRGQRC